MSEYITKGAHVSNCGTYRYCLWREWRLHPEPAIWHMWEDDDGNPVVDGAGQQIGEPLACVFVMLNPSTADGDVDDPTIRRCVAFAKRFGFDRLEVVNLFAYRATKPSDMFDAAPNLDVIGWENQNHVNRALDGAGMIICAWGAHGGFAGQDETMLGWIDVGNWRDAPVVALGTTKEGHPRHPLYLKSDSSHTPYSGRGQ